MDIVITKKLIQCVQGKQIKDFRYENFYKGERPLDYTVILDNLDKIAGNFITKADSNTLFLDNDYVVTFGYSNDGIKYFPDMSKMEIMKKDKKLITGGFAFIFILEDGSCLVISTNSWTGSFRVLKQSEYIPPEKISPHDREKFTLDAFRSHFNKNIGVMAVCGTSKGFMDAQRDFLHEALFRSKIHPKTKASRLTDAKIENLYKIMTEIAGEIEANGAINETVNTGAAGKPCPVCGTLIEKGSAFASSIFYCPNCQQEK